MNYWNRAVGAFVGLSLCMAGADAIAQSAADQGTAGTPVAAPAQPVPAQPPPAQSAQVQPAPLYPRAQAPQPVAPPGYVLVPAGSAYYTPVAPRRAASRDLPYSEGEPIPPGYHLEEHVRKGLVIGGAVTTGTLWMFSATAAVGDDFNHKTGYLMVPALGPWLMLAAGGGRDNCSTDYMGRSTCSIDAGVRALLFLDGVVQTAGAVMFAFGIGYPSKRLVPNNMNLSLAPMNLGKDGYGLGAVGTF